MFEKKGNALYYGFDTEKVLIEPWGNGVRIRATKCQKFPEENWALLDTKPVVGEIKISQDLAEVSNGKIRVSISKAGKIEIFKSSGEKILEEYSRNRKSVTDPKCSALEIEAREFKPIIGSDSFHLTLRFESLDKDEKIF